MQDKTGASLWSRAEAAFDSAHVNRLPIDRRNPSEPGSTLLVQWLERLADASKGETLENINRGHRIAHLYGLGGAGKTRLLHEVKQRANKDKILTFGIELTKEDEIGPEGIRWTKLLSNHLEGGEMSISGHIVSGGRSADRSDMRLFSALIRYFSPAAQIASAPSRSKIWPGLSFVLAIALIGIVGFLTTPELLVLKILITLGSIAAFLYPVYEFLSAKKADPTVQAAEVKKELKKIGLNIDETPIFLGEGMDQWSKKAEKEFEKVIAAALSLILLRISTRNRSPVVILLDVEYLPAHVDAIDSSISTFIDSMQAWSDDWKYGLSKDEWKAVDRHDLALASGLSFNPSQKRTGISKRSILGSLISHKMVSPLGDLAHTRIVIDPFTPKEQRRLYKKFMHYSGSTGREIEKHLCRLQDSFELKNLRKPGLPPWPTNILTGEATAEPNILPRDIRLSTQAALTLATAAPSEINLANLQNHFRSVWHSRAIDRLFPKGCNFRDIVSTLACVPFFPGSLLDRFNLPEGFPDPRDNQQIRNSSWFRVVAHSSEFGPLFALNRRIRTQLLTYRAHCTGNQHRLIAAFIRDEIGKRTEYFESETRRQLLCIAASMVASLVQGSRLAEAENLAADADLNLLSGLSRRATNSDEILIDIAIYEEIRAIKKRLEFDLRLNWLPSTAVGKELLNSCDAVLAGYQESISRSPSKVAIEQIRQQYETAANTDDFWSSLENFPGGPPWKIWPRYEIERPNDGLENALKLLWELEQIKDESVAGKKVLLKFRESMIHRLERSGIRSSTVSDLRQKQLQVLQDLLMTKKAEEYLDNSFIARVIRTSEDEAYEAAEKILDLLLSTVSEFSESSSEDGIQFMARVAKRIAEKLSPEDLCNHILNLLESRRRSETILAWHYVLFEFTNCLFRRFVEDHTTFTRSVFLKIQDVVHEYRSTRSPNITLSSDSSPWERHVAWAIEQTSALFDLWARLFDGSEKYGHGDIARLAISAEHVHQLEMLSLFAYWLIYPGDSSDEKDLARLLILGGCIFRPRVETGSMEENGDATPYIKIHIAKEYLPENVLEKIVRENIGDFTRRSSGLMLSVEDALRLVECLYHTLGSATHQNALLRWIAYRLMHLCLVIFKVANDQVAWGNEDTTSLQKCIQLYTQLALLRNAAKFGETALLDSQKVCIPKFSAESASKVLIETAARYLSRATLKKDDGDFLTGRIILASSDSALTEAFPKVGIFDPPAGSANYQLDFTSGSDQSSGLLPPALATAWMSFQSSLDEFEYFDINENHGGRIKHVKEQDGGGYLFCAVTRGTKRTKNGVVLKCTSRGASFVAAVSDAILPMGFIPPFSPEEQLPWSSKIDQTLDLFMVGSNTVSVVPVSSETKGVLILGDGSVLKGFEDICGLRRVALIDVPDIRETASHSTHSLRDSLDERYVRSLLSNFYEDLTLQKLGNPSLFSSDKAGKDQRKDRTFVSLYRKFTGRTAVIVRTESADLIDDIGAPAEYWDRIDLEWAHRDSRSSP